MNDTFIRQFYLCGIPVLSLHQQGDTKLVKLGPIPILKIVDHETKLCGYLGPIKLFKVRYKGVRPLPNMKPSFSPVNRPVRKLFFDIGSLHQKNGQYGIARVAFELLKALRKLMPSGYEVYPVYSRADKTGYFYANRYFHGHFENVKVPDFDLPIEISSGDIFLNVVTDIANLPLQRKALHAMSQSGVRVLFVFYDLIPLSHPHCVGQKHTEAFSDWLYSISEFDGIIADSASAANDYRLWREQHWQGTEPFSIDWFHLGADFKTNSAATELSEDAASVLASIKARPSLLEVSTVEPRKGHKQTLAAFEQLWAKGVDASYIIVGNKGWMMDDFCTKVEKHPELGRRLFWLKGISDEYLDAVYEAVSGVIMPSEAEGFGLAIIEGAHHGKPLILRDIPVFREIAGEHATYFSGLSPEPLADCIEQWLCDFASGNATPSTGIRPLTWNESAAMLLEKLGVTSSTSAKEN